jgi:hypothetical protein
MGAVSRSCNVALLLPVVCISITSLLNHVTAANPTAAADVPAGFCVTTSTRLVLLADKVLAAAA